MFWTLLIAIGLAWVIQSWLSFKQTEEFTREFLALRRKGRVAMGKFRGGLTAGAIVMAALDDDDRIVEGRHLVGVTVLARFKPLDLYDGQFVTTIDPSAAARYGPSSIKAIENLVHNYRVASGGGTPVEPPTALARMLDKLPGITPKKRVLATPGAGAAPAKRKMVHRAKATK